MGCLCFHDLHTNYVCNLQAAIYKPLQVLSDVPHEPFALPMRRFGYLTQPLFSGGQLTALAESLLCKIPGTKLLVPLM